MQLFDNKSQTLREFKPLIAGKVGIYVCGPTVQSAPHIGHLRSALVYDALSSWLKESGLEVTLIRNVTDIDDKVLEKSQEAGVSWWNLAYSNEQVFAADYRRLGIQLPSNEPRATAHIPQMIALIELLIEKGHAYRALDGSSDVFFDTASWPSYGELTNQKPQDMESDAVSSTKKNPQDFALWKSAKDSEPKTASWESPFGQGRPGWHIECSAMATHYLGESFDIHGGGLDLRFPHHENELAQSSAAGHKFANLWMHNGLVNIQGQKMSKSLGNSVSSAELFDLASPQAVRYYLLSAHYRSTLDYQPGVLQEAETALERIYGFLERAERELAPTRFAEAEKGIELPEAFVSEMNQDLNIPAAFAVIHESVRSGNTDLDEQRIREANQRRSEILRMLEILGLSPSSWGQNQSNEHAVLDQLIQGLIRARNKAREEKDYARADEIRDQLTACGIELSDSSNQTHWSLS
ncbi:MAG: cysteine--tRNA ligase [Aquiluna sp.]|nr:cysteine--tRNA ligase [Aquiluna sp.]MCF8545429.1 cysteine--tRNA ligase [Aquiluna sp.]